MQSAMHGNETPDSISNQGYSGLEMAIDTATGVFVPRENEVQHARHVSTNMNATVVYDSEKEPVVTGRAEKWRVLWRRKKIIWAAVILFIIVIVGAVIGGVVGSRKSPATSSKINQNTPDNGPSSTVTEGFTTQPKLTPQTTSSQHANPTSSPRGSALAAAAWPDDEGESITFYLAYENSDGDLALKMRVIKGDNVNDAPWSDPEVYSTGMMQRGIQSIAMSLTFVNNELHLQMLYVDREMQIKALYRNEKGQIKPYQSDQFNYGDIRTIADGQIASCGPWFVYQDRRGLLQSLWWDEANIKWEFYAFNQTALPGTPIAAIPFTTNFTQIQDEGKFAIFSQDRNRNLQLSPNPSNGGNPHKPGDTSFDRVKNMKSWPKTFPDGIDPREGIHFAGISRPTSAGNMSEIVDTFILLQNNSYHMLDYSTIAGDDWGYFEDDDKIFTDANKGTNIACANIPPWKDYSKVWELMELEGWRCYFWQNSGIYEVKNDWVVWKGPYPVVVP